MIIYELFLVNIRTLHHLNSNYDVLNTTFNRYRWKTITNYNPNSHEGVTVDGFKTSTQSYLCIIMPIGATGKGQCKPIVFILSVGWDISDFSIAYLLIEDDYKIQTTYIESNKYNFKVIRKSTEEIQSYIKLHIIGDLY